MVYKTLTFNFFPMIRTTIFLHILFICLSTPAQDTPPSLTMNYAYDANGNRIHRWVTVEEAPVPDTTGLLKNLAVVKTGTAGATETETGRARLWPNPTPGSLELSIPWAGEHMPVEYGCYSLAGVELLRGKTGTVSTKIDISRYPPGSYVLVLFGKERDVVWKVVRY